MLETLVSLITRVCECVGCSMCMQVFLCVCVCVFVCMGKFVCTCGKSALPANPPHEVMYA